MLSYRIEDYTERQLYDILELVNPTDRELEAKIMYYIRKYETAIAISPDPEKEKMRLFFENMYDYFFYDEYDSDNEPYKEGFESQPETEGGSKADATGAISKEAATAAYDPANISLTKSVDYSEDPDKLNPILKQTVTTLMTVDSRYREEKYSKSTNFSFNLSRPLRDVISMKLYSVQIPYTWWTINNYYGGNFFYLKGNVPGIDNGNHDYKIEIDPGNYTGESITTAVNTYITNTMPTIYTDLSLSGTYLEYTSSNSKSKMHVKIEKQFVETDYKIYFPPVESTLQYNTLYNFFGYTSNTYDFNSLKSDTKYSSNASANTNIYTIDDTNNTFQVIQYTQEQTTDNPYGTYDSSTSTKLFTHEITLENGTYNEAAVVTLLNTALASYSHFTNSSVTKVSSSSTSSSSYYYNLYIQLDRFSTFNVAGAKLFVKFPQETATYPIWTEENNSSAQNCCFSFTALENELSNLVSSNQPKPTSYVVEEDLSFSIICTNPYYVDALNDYFFDVSSSVGTDTTSTFQGEYIISEYIAAFNTALSYTNEQTYSQYNPTGILNLTNTYAYLDGPTQKIKVKFDINKTFTQNMFTADLSASFFSSAYGFSRTISDMSVDASGTFTRSSVYEINDSNNKIYFYAKSGFGLSSRTPFEVTFPTGTYKSLALFIEMLNETFQTFEDESGEKIFSSTVVSYNTNLPTNKITMKIKFRLNKTLTENDYKVVFYDTSTTTTTTKNYWLTDLKFSSSYTLSDYAVDAGSSVYYSLISGTSNLDAVYFTIDASNDTFYFLPQTDGVATTTGDNDITFTIPHGSYSQDQIIEKVNALLAETTETAGSYLYLNSAGYMVMRIYINKVYKAEDFRLVFYDVYSFIECANTSSSVNGAWDNTLGWLLGFQSVMEFPLSTDETYSTTNTYTLDTTTNEVVLGGDTVLNTNRINYAMIILNDYNQNHLNNSLVTVIGGENTTSLPSYANYYKCSNNSVQRGGLSVDPTTNKALTQNQLYAIEQTQQGNLTITAQNVYTKGPNVKDIFAMIPIKTTGMSTGQVYTEFGGSLQNQIRDYFGPVNIQRISVSLLADNGQVLDLNGSNWSFTVIIEQLYNTSATRPGKKMA